MYISPSRQKENQTINKFVNDINHEKTWANDDLNLDDHYILNRKLYDESSEIYQEINPVCIIQTGILLPFYLPIEDKAFTLPFYKFREEARCAITLHFSSVNDDMRFTGGFIQEKGIRYVKKRTRCEITVLFIEDLYILEDRTAISVLNIAELVKQSKSNKNIRDQDFLDCTRFMLKIIDSIIHNSLEIINSFILSYAKTNNADSVYCVTAKNIEHVSHFRVIEPKEWKTYNWMHINNTYFPKEQVACDNDQLQNIFRDVSVQHGNFFETYYKYYQKGLFEYQNGDPSSSILYIILSIEVLVRKIVKLFHVKIAKMTEEDSSDRIESCSFKNLLDTELPSAIGGNWDLSKKGSIPYVWYTRAYALRGRIVHGGYSPDDMEIVEAINQSSELHYYIFKLLNRRKRKLEKIINEFSSPFRHK